MKTTQFKAVSQNSSGPNLQANGADGLLFLFGFLALLIPVVGWVVGPALISTGFYRMGREYFGKAKDGTAKRNLQRGPCPHCGHVVTVNAPAARVRFACPQCKTQLIYDTGLVSIEN